jgi:DNA-binding beta-propeller fold protein YncE
VWVLFDASLGMAGLVLAVDGLGLGIPLSDPAHPAVRLDGFGVAYSKPPLAIKGALVNRPPDQTYELLVQGVLVLSAQKFGLTALGAYARARQSPHDPSMFLFGKATGRFGGPPPVQITGIMAGLGFNTSVHLPEGDRVLDFPFLKDLTSTDPDADPMEVLNGLMNGPDAWVRPAVGQMWFAAGLAFSVFEFIQGQGLLVLEVGDDFAIALLGTAEARFPKDIPVNPYAQVRLGLSAKYRASEGVLKLTAQLAPGSYVIDRDCVLTGGFALYIWLDDAHAGDFVLTLGGYHPRFPVPRHYPTVPRLGFSWPVTRELTISGGAYFALTPGALMAGGALDVNYRSGDLHAWLTAHADMLIEWVPFRFDVEIGISIGVSYVLNLWLVRETIRVEVGATLRLWGPPTAGEVTVHLWFISFTVSFGSGPSQQDSPAPWSDVVKQLPAPQDAVRLTPMDGLSPARAKDEHGTGMWIATPGAFSFAVRAAVPVTTLNLGEGSAATPIPGHEVNIRPRRDQGRHLDSVLTVTLFRGTVQQPLSDWYAGPGAQVRSSLPTALWGGYENALTPQSPQWVDDQLMGVDLRLPLPEEGYSPGPIRAGALAHDERMPDGTLPLRSAAQIATATVPPAASTAQTAPAPSMADLTARAGAASRSQQEGVPDLTPLDWARDRLFTAMGHLGVSPGTNDRLAPDDPLVSGDVHAQPEEILPGDPTAAGPRLYAAGTGRTATPVDAHSLTAYEPASLGSQSPTHLALTPDGRRLVVIDAYEGVDILDVSVNPPGTAPSLLPERLWLPQRPRSLAVSPDSKWAYATFASPDQLVMLDLAASRPKIHRQYGTQTLPGGVAAAAGWNRAQIIYLAQPDKGTVVRLDVTGGKWPTPAGELPGGPDPVQLAVDPRGRWLYALNSGHSTVSVVDTAVGGHGVLATLRTGTDPVALALSPDGARLYAAAATSGTVSVFDVSGTEPREAADPVWVGPNPVDLAVSTAGDRLFVALAGHKGLRVLDLTGDRPSPVPSAVPLPDTPVALAATVAPQPPSDDHPRSPNAEEGGAA